MEYRPLIRDIDAHHLERILCHVPEQPFVLVANEHDSDR